LVAQTDAAISFKEQDMNKTSVLLAAALLLQGTVFAAVSDADRDFVTQIAAAGAAEVAVGETATAHAGSSAVRDFAQQMITDHTKANAELKAIAEAKGIEAQAIPNSEQKAAHEKLKTLSGAEFDAEYARLMREDHEKAVSAFRQESEHGGDPQLREFATKTLPTLEHHLEMAKALPTGGHSNAGHTGHSN
jgi:putative membrane protein